MTLPMDQDKPLKIKNYIGGVYTDTEQCLDSYDPSTGRVWAKIPDSGEAEVNAAVIAAKTAFETWHLTTPEHRSDLLSTVANLLESRLEKFAEFESRDQGKPVSLARDFDIPRAVHNFRFFATSVLHTLNTSTFLGPPKALSYTTRDSVGVAGVISPWNLPLYLLTFKIAPAIAWGNTVVCKPSEMTSVTAWMLCDVLHEAGVPPGVVNMVFGTGPKAGAAIVRHPDVPLISFTGSTLTAEDIRQATVSRCKKLSLELGGKNAAVVFEDADLTKCLPRIIKSSFANQGEICLCTSRLFVHKNIYKDFLKAFVYEARKIKVGDPRASDTWMGALISESHMNKVKGYIRLAEDEGATILTGNEPDRLNLPDTNSKGYFVPPTVVVDVLDTSRLMKEEIFGPVVCVVPFETLPEVLERVNDVEYGLCACVWSTNVNTIHTMARGLQVGTVWANCWIVRDLNMPFGGIKQSGIGREGHQESLEFFTEVKTVCVQLD